MLKLLCPVTDGWISKAYVGNTPKHWGVDYGWVNNAYCDVLAPYDAKCVDNFYSDSCGYSLVLQIECESGKHRFITFIHLKAKSPVKIGQTVKQGEVVGTRGSTGKSSGPHLHFGLTQEMDLSYKWAYVKQFTTDPHPFCYKSKNLKYKGVMFDKMPVLEGDEEELAELREQVARLSYDLAVARDKLAKVRELVKE